MFIKRRQGEGALEDGMKEVTGEKNGKYMNIWKYISFSIETVCEKETGNPPSLNGWT